MIILNLITFACVLALLVLINKVYRAQKEYILQQTSIMKMQSIYLQFLSAAATSNLWVLRHKVNEIQNKFSQQENFEGAKDARNMMKNLDYLIELHNKIIENESQVN